MKKNKTATKPTGDKGEKIAVSYLESKNYKILDRNWRVGKYEIDIIAQTKETIVFVEVKTRKQKDFEQPSELFTQAQQKRIISAAHDYLVSKDIDLEARFDLIIILLSSNKEKQIEHIVEAFYPTR